MSISMDYSLLSSAGNLIDWLSTEAEARSALQRMVDAEPDAAAEVALFVSGANGTSSRAPIHAVPASAL